MADREALQEKWESDMMADDSDSDSDMGVFDDGWASSDDPYDLGTMGSVFGAGGLYTMKTKPPKAPKVDRRGEPIGITPRLVKVWM